MNTMNTMNNANPAWPVQAYILALRRQIRDFNGQVIEALFGGDEPPGTPADLGRVQVRWEHTPARQGS